MTAPAQLDLLAEEWRPVVGHEGRYEVSSLGRVRSLRFVNGKANRLRPSPLVMRQSRFKSTGYLFVSICYGSKVYTRSVHRLVAAAFLGPPPSPKSQAAHLDGTRTNNAADNLVWASALENNRHKHAHGTTLRGEQNPYSKLTESDVVRIRERRAEGAILRVIADEFGIHLGHVWDICNGVAWRHVAPEQLARLTAQRDAVLVQLRAVGR